MAETHLILVRHATAEEQSASGEDFDRRLTQLGVEQASIVSNAARLLRFPEPQLIFTSGYVRARQTRSCYDWLSGDEHHDEVFSPWGNVASARELLSSYLIQAGKNAHCAWVFSHNPFLSSFLQNLTPDIFRVVGRFRKSDCVWLRWRSKEGFLSYSADLKGFLSKPK